MYCKNCGKEIEQDLMFCDQCGAQLKEDWNIKSKTTSLGGWLVLFQLRIFILAVTAVLWLTDNPICLAVTFILAASSAVLFYMKNHLFRPLYLGAAVFMYYSLMLAAVQDMTLNYMPMDLIMQSLLVYVDIGIIIPLFLSKRVRNTFPMPGDQLREETILNDVQPIAEEKKLVGYYGWLAWFQVQLVAGIVLLLATVLVDIPLIMVDIVTGYIIPIGSIIALGTCAVFFYQRKLQFRWAYVAYQIMWLIQGVYTLQTVDTMILTGVTMILGLALQIVITVALFTSRRIKNTFA